MLSYAIAIVPLAIYLLMIGGLHLRKRPLVTSGWRDMLALGIACLGLVTVGPMQLFFPIRAAAVIPTLSWAMMFALYFMVLVLILLWSKPRLTVYGMTSEQFREAVHAAARVVDSQANWYGDVLTLPQAGMQLVMEPGTTTRVNSVAKVGAVNNASVWKALERELVGSAQQADVRPAGSGWILVGLAAILLASIAPVIIYPDTTYAELREFLWR